MAHATDIQTTKTSANITELKALYIMFNYSFYWLSAMVKQGLITKAEAGYIITSANSKGDYHAN